MPTLALDTATQVASVAVTDGKDILAEITLGPARSHSERILPAIDLLLTEVGLTIGGIDTIAVSKGPGSFTGLRIGLSLAKGLAGGRNIPLVSVSTLRVLAEQAILHRGFVTPLLSAQRGQFYAALYKSSGAELQEEKADTVIGPEDLRKWVDETNGVPLLLTGEAAHLVGDSLLCSVAPPSLRMPRAGVLGLLAACHAPRPADETYLNYIRPSSAQPRKRM
jgi:tRNA threonylcarbamoyladenosine biosynthesis protein TsaB